MNLAGIPIITLFDGRKERQNETKQKRKEQKKDLEILGEQK
jgi:hypothetical protein